jgi:hypothetical protein
MAAGTAIIAAATAAAGTASRFAELENGLGESSPGPLPFVSARSDSFLQRTRKKPSNFVPHAQCSLRVAYARARA